MLSFLLRLNENMYHTMSRHFGLGYQTGYHAKAKRSSANRANVRLLDPLAFVFPLHRVFDTFNHLTFVFPLLETFNNLTFALVEFGGALAR